MHSLSGLLYKLLWFHEDTPHPVIDEILRSQFDNSTVELRWVEISESVIKYFLLFCLMHHSVLPERCFLHSDVVDANDGGLQA